MLYYGFKDALKYMIANQSFQHPCRDASFAMYCNIQTENIMAKNLDKFFKIMLLSSTLNIKNNVDVVDKFINMKIFKEKFRVLNSTVKKDQKWPFLSCGFRKTLSDDDEDVCKVMSPTLTPLGVCSSFNSLSYKQIYTSSEHSNTWSTIVNEEDVLSK